MKGGERNDWRGSQREIVDGRICDCRVESVDDVMCCVKPTVVKLR